MNLRDLEYFVAVAELRHFSRAAKRCNVSQPTLSGQIKKLEETLGVRLFERTNRRVLLTEVGQQLAESADRILKEIDGIYEIADSARDSFAGNFRLGAFPTLASYVFPQVVAQIRSCLPKLKLMLVEEKTDLLIEQLREGKLDAALLALPVETDFLTGMPLFDDPFYLAVPMGHTLADRQHVEQAILSDYKLLLLNEGHCLRDQSLDLCNTLGVSEYEDFRATSLETLRQMVKAGTGITLIPKIALGPSDSSIRYMPFLEPVPSRTIGLFWRQTSPRTELMNEVVALLQDTLN